MAQLGAILAAGGRAAIEREAPGAERLARLPPELADRVTLVGDWREEGLSAALFEGEGEALVAFLQALAERPGPVVSCQALSAGARYDIGRLLEETSVSTNTAAAGGNASLMSVG